MLDQNLLLKYFKGDISYKAKKKAVAQYVRLKKHAAGDKKGELITRRRPNEPIEFQKYREEIEVEKTKHPISKTLSSLRKIRRSQDWKVEYKKEDIPAYIPEDFTLQEYLEEKYPVYDSIDNWLFDEALYQSLIDSMCLICIAPFYITETTAELIKPYATIVNCDNIIEFIDGKLAIVKSPNKYKYTVGGVKKESDIFVVFTPEDIQQWTSTEQGRYIMINEYIHNTGELMCFRPRGIYKENIDGDILWESPLSPMLPHLDEAAREYSDMQAEKILHLYSEKWQYTTNECKKCNGQGRIKVDGVAPITFSTCKDCNGSGLEVISPFKSKTLKFDPKFQSNYPTPPMGYVQKNTDISKIMKENVQEHMYLALESVEMQFLAQVPTSQSGIAKEWDRDENFNFCYMIASMLVYIRSNVAYYVNEMRYVDIVPDKKTREAMCPHQEIPVKYDIVTSSVLIDEYSKLSTAKVSPVLLAASQIDIAQKRFNDKPEVASFTKLTFELDPLCGLSEDDKVMRLQNKGITEQDYVISCNIQKFVKRAISENPAYNTLEYKEQSDILVKYAEEVIKSYSTADMILPNATA